MTPAIQKLLEALPEGQYHSTFTNKYALTNPRDHRRNMYEVLEYRNYFGIPEVDILYYMDHKEEIPLILATGVLTHIGEHTTLSPLPGRELRHYYRVVYMVEKVYLEVLTTILNMA